MNITHNGRTYRVEDEAEIGTLLLALEALDQLAA